MKVSMLLGLLLVSACTSTGTGPASTTPNCQQFSELRAHSKDEASSNANVETSHRYVLTSGKDAALIVGRADAEGSSDRASDDSAK